MRSETNAATKAILSALEGAVDESARAIRDEARRLVPRDTGRLADNITANVDGLSAKVGVFDDESYYGQFVEFGTSDQPSQPFMTPAVEAERKRLPDRLRSHVEGKL